MPLTPNQRKAIDLLIVKGKELPSDLSLAVVAALDAAEASATALRSQVTAAENQARTLLWERDETQRLRREVETEIDRRVSLRTHDQDVELQQLRDAKGRVESEYNGLLNRLDQKERINQRRIAIQVQLDARIDELESFLYEALGVSWFKKWVWRRQVKRVLNAPRYQLNPSDQCSNTVTTDREV